MPSALKWILRIVGGLVAVIAIFMIVIYIVSGSKLDATFDTTTESVTINTDSAALARGAYLATTIGKCYHCHGNDFGGKVVFSDPMIGTIVAPNITSGEGSVVRDFKSEDWVRVIRYGVKPDGHGAVVMPSTDYWYMDDREMGDLIGYIQSLPPVNRQNDPHTFGPMGRALFVMGMLPLFEAEKIDRTASRGVTPPAGVTAEYGGHLANIGGCTGCHSKDLGGGPIEGAPPGFKPAANLTPHADGLKEYSEADFFQAVRTGTKKNGEQMNKDEMPWDATSQMTDDDTRALWAYIRSIPPVPSDWKE